MSYTKGPWNTYVDEEDEPIATYDGSNKRMTIADFRICSIDSNEKKANAKLISAAPELYEALKELLESEWMVTHDWGGDRNAVIGKAKEALKKAEL